MRTAFISQLIQEAEKNSKIFLIVADLGYSVIEEFEKKFPNQFLNIGIAEQNMAGVAAGLAKDGYIVYIYSIGNFPTLRCMEQIRYDICYHNLNVNIIAVGGGYAYGALGPSHHTTEELGMLRTIPNLYVSAPGDPIETKKIIELSAINTHPFYIRLGKAGEEIVHENLINGYEIGNILNINKDVNNTNCIFSTGSMLSYCKNFLKNNDIESSLYSFPFINPINKISLNILFKMYKNIITIEEHQLNSGFGSCILEHLNDFREQRLIENNDIPIIKRVGIDNKFYSVAGSQSYLRELSGIKLHENHFIK